MTLTNSEINKIDKIALLFNSQVYADKTGKRGVRVEDRVIKYKDTSIKENFWVVFDPEGKVYLSGDRGGRLMTSVNWKTLPPYDVLNKTLYFTNRVYE